MKLKKAHRRDKKRNKKINGMRTDGKSVFVIQHILTVRSDKKST